MIPHQTDPLSTLLDVTEVVDALHRFAAGQDHKDRELFRSAFAPHATLDFTEPARRFGGDVPLLEGRDVIEGILDVLEPLVTTHTVTNPRVTVDGDRATLNALVEAQHVERADPDRHLLLKNFYDVTTIRDGGRFVIESMVIRNVWSDGDPSVLFGATAARSRRLEGTSCTRRPAASTTPWPSNPPWCSSPWPSRSSSPERRERGRRRRGAGRGGGSRRSGRPAHDVTRAVDARNDVVSSIQEIVGMIHESWTRADLLVSLAIRQGAGNRWESRSG